MSKVTVAARDTGMTGGALIILPVANRILEEVLEDKLTSGQKGPVDIRLNDMDKVSYHISSEDATPNIISVSMNVGCYQDLNRLGAGAILSDLYGSILAAQPKKGADVTLDIDMDKLPGPPEDIAHLVSLLKANVMGAPLYKNFKSLIAGQKEGKPDKVEISKNTTMFVFPYAERVLVVYALTFNDHAESVISKVFLNEFVEGRRACQQAPICAFDVKPPMEMKAFGVVKPEAGVMYLSFTVLKQHVNSDEKLDNAVHLLQGLRGYIQYHIKCSKAFWHSRMRARVIALLGILNRAKTHIKEVKKVTASGRTFHDPSKAAPSRFYKADQD